jgi:hypothetical protein
VALEAATQVRSRPIQARLGVIGDAAVACGSPLELVRWRAPDCSGGGRKLGAVCSRLCRRWKMDSFSTMRVIGDREISGTAVRYYVDGGVTNMDDVAPIRWICIQVYDVTIL